MIIKAKLTKTIILTILIINYNLLNADILKNQEKEKEKNTILIEKVFKSKYKSFDLITFNFDKDYNLIYNKNGIVNMYISKNYMNINLDKIFDYIKFDIKIDKDKIYKCSINNQDVNCNKKYNTISAADDISGGLINLASALFKEGLSVEKKFDALEFSKIINNNKNFIKQVTTRHITYKLNKQEKVNTIQLEEKTPHNSRKIKIEEGW